MKTYIFTKSKSTVSRTYGGENYTLQVYEVKSKNNIIHIGETSACSRGHKGESSEAYSVVFNSLSKRKQNEIKRISKDPENSNLGLVNYYSWSYTPELLKITLKEV
jgi:hypothetical protein